MRLMQCCKLRTLVLAIGITFLVVQAGLLILNVLLLADIESHVTRIIQWLDSNRIVEANIDLVDLKNVVARRATDFMAIPITLNIVLMLANSLLIWAVMAEYKLLLWPWMVLYGLEWILLTAVMVFLVIILFSSYMKAILFLVLCPFLVVFAFCWFVVKCFYNYLRDLNLKQAMNAIYQQTPYSNKSDERYAPPTVYATEPQSWDQPLPIWALRPGPGSQQPVLDPIYLQQMDPRYAHIMPPNPQGGHHTYFRSSKPGSNSHYSGGSSARPRVRATPTMLPDGTLVVPISNESTEEDNLTEIHEEDEEQVSSPGHSVAGTRTSKNGSNRFSKAETGSVALSDKYRVQEEVIEEFTPRTAPPRPIPPPPQSLTLFGMDDVASSLVAKSDKMTEFVSPQSHSPDTNTASTLRIS